MILTTSTTQEGPIIVAAPDTPLTAKSKCIKPIVHHTSDLFCQQQQEEHLEQQQQQPCLKKIRRSGKKTVRLDLSLNQYYNDETPEGPPQEDNHGEPSTNSAMCCWYTKEDYKTFRQDTLQVIAKNQWQEDYFRKNKKTKKGNNKTLRASPSSSMLQLYSSITREQAHEFAHGGPRAHDSLPLSLLSPEQHGLLQQMYSWKGTLADVSESALDRIGLEQQLIPLLRRDMRQRREATHECVLNIQEHFMDTLMDMELDPHLSRMEDDDCDDNLMVAPCWANPQAASDPAGTIAEDFGQVLRDVLEPMSQGACLFSHLLAVAQWNMSSSSDDDDASSL